MHFDLFKAAGEGEEGGDEAPPADDEGSDEAKAAVPKEEPEKTFFVPDVMMGKDSNRMHWVGTPANGSLFGIRLDFEATLNDTALSQVDEKEREAKEIVLQEWTAAKEAEAAAKEQAAKEAEEAAAAAAAEEQAKADAAAAAGEEYHPPEVEVKKEVPPETDEERVEREAKEAADRGKMVEAKLYSLLPKDKKQFILLVDTVGQDALHRLNDKKIGLITKSAQALRTLFVTLDKKLFADERARREQLKELNASLEEPREIDMKHAKDSFSERLLADGKPNTEADLSYCYAQSLCYGMRKLLSELAAHWLLPGPLNVLVAVLFLLDYEPKAVVDKEGQPEWDLIKKRLNDDLFERLRTFEPRQHNVTSRSHPHATIKAIAKLVAGLDYAAIKEKSLPLAQLLTFVKSALAVKKLLRQEKKIAAENAKKEAEEKARLEAEEKARLEAEAEAAAAAEADANAAEAEAAPAE